MWTWLLSRKSKFQHAAARRRLGYTIATLNIARLFQHAAARRRLDWFRGCIVHNLRVSTRSRPKAAGVNFGYIATAQVSFNTQPPEGGWF